MAVVAAAVKVQFQESRNKSKDASMAVAAAVKVQSQEEHAAVTNNGSHNMQVINNGSENDSVSQVINNESAGPKSQRVINNESVGTKSQGVFKNGSQKEKENIPVGPKSLYVGDLERNVSDAQIQELFQRVGPVVSVRICRDAITKASLGYGYVNYSTPENASEALRSLNFTPLNGKPIRIMYSQRDPSIRRCGSANIFIKNLHKAVDNKTLYHKFCVFGPILSSKIAIDDASGQSKGYGFVHFEQDEAAQNAIKCMNGALINDRPVYVGPFMKKEEREELKFMKKKKPEPQQTKFMKKPESDSDSDSESQQTNGEAKFKNVFVNNLPDSMNDEDMRNYFGRYGTITSVAVMRDEAGKSKCFGFVNFDNAHNAAKCVESLNGKKIDGKELYVGKALKKSELRGQSGTNLYLKHLDDSIDDNKLRELFSIYGTITSCKVMRDFHGYSKGFGFVSFSSRDEASRALAEMTKKIVIGKPLYVSLAQPKEERRAKLQSHFSQLLKPEPQQTKFMKKELQRESEAQQTNGEAKFKNVFVNNLPDSMNDEDMRNYFGKYGTITSVAVMRDEAGKSMCFGFVNFENAHDAAKCVESLNGKKIDGRECYVGKALKKSELRGQSGTNLYLKHLDDILMITS